MITRESEIEYKHWQILCEEARDAGIDPNNKNFNALFRAIAMWGESLVALRVTQTEEERAKAASMAIQRFNAVKKGK